MDTEAVVSLIALLSFGLGSAIGSAATVLTQALIRKYGAAKDEAARLPSKLDEVLDRIGDRLESLEERVEFSERLLTERSGDSEKSRSK
ncbi:MAG: hypothetical protein JSU87_00575 [Gemmatimonadota bacterium]|nr:MAG: hypothetical protein JSU87_00575 [Gemmatimonadota bacterium]